MSESAQKPAIFNAATLDGQAENLKTLSEISKNSRTTFMIMLLACVYCFLTIASTTDVTLLTNSTASSLPIIETSVPIGWFYHFAPLLLITVFLYFHLYLRRFWRCVGKLPLVHDTDGRRLDDYIYPWLISAAVIRAEVPELRSKKHAFWPLESVVSIFMAWWLIPLVLVFFWVRYLPAHNWIGTGLHVVIIAFAVSSAVHFYQLTKSSLNTLSPRKRAPDSPLGWVTSASSGLLAFVALLFVSFGALNGAPSDKCQMVVVKCTIVHSGVKALEVLGYDPYLDITESEVSQKPENYHSLLSEAISRTWLDRVDGPNLSGKDLQFATANSSFLAGADFSHTNLRWVEFKNSVLVGTDLSDAEAEYANLSKAQLQWSELKRANLSNSNLNLANLQWARLDNVTLTGASLWGAEFQRAIGPEANFTRAVMIGSKLEHAEFPNANFEDAQLTRAKLGNGNFEGASFKGANLEQTNFERASLYSVRFVNARLQESNMAEADLHSADLSEADLTFSTLRNIKARKANFSGATLRNADLDGADLRKTNFMNADLTHARLTSTDLSDADLTKAKLVGADFNKAQLFGTVFQEANLSGADFSGVLGLNPHQLASSCGDKRTRLPKSVTVAPCPDENSDVARPWK